jgi:hypothetical protein
MTDFESEADLEALLLRLYRKWETLGYRASRFYQMFMPHCKQYRGGIAAIRNVVSKSGTGGFEKLVEMGRLDLTVEKAIILNPKWISPFQRQPPQHGSAKSEPSFKVAHYRNFGSVSVCQKHNFLKRPSVIA